MSEDQFTGDFNVMLLIDNTARKVPIARITVDTPYPKGASGRAVSPRCHLRPDNR